MRSVQVMSKTSGNNLPENWLFGPFLSFKFSMAVILDALQIRYFTKVSCPPGFDGLSTFVRNEVIVE